jgi:hypothetical protein
MPEQWNNFFVMVGGGAAALAGLIFVAMSINHEVIFRNTTHKNRAIWLIASVIFIRGYVIAIIVLFAFLISGAWLLMIGIYEDRAKR